MFEWGGPQSHFLRNLFFRFLDMENRREGRALVHIDQIRAFGYVYTMGRRISQAYLWLSHKLIL